MTNYPTVLRTLMSYVTSTFNFSTSWALGPTFDLMTGFTAYSKLKVYYYIPGRNDSGGWGGGYIELQYSINGGAWRSLGSGGYDAGVMHLNAYAIARYSNLIYIDPGMSTEYTVRFRVYCRSYDGTYTVNGSNNINATSGTASFDSDPAHYYQWYAHIIVEEITGQ